MKLHVIVASTREQRVGRMVGDWFFERAKAHGKLEPTLVDLKEVALPMLDEPNHPRLRQYQFAHTKAWSALVDAADAFAIVTPEYNYGMAPALLNALNYLFQEWAYKPVCFVSYGGVSGGTRSVQMAKQVITSLKMMPIPEGVFIPFVSKLIEDGRFKGGDPHDRAVAPMLDELARWAEALKVMRKNA